MNFQLLVSCKDGEANVRMTRITYDYDTARTPQHYSAEEWITDKYAVNKKGTKLYPLSGKFRRKTIDRKDFIFNKFESLLNEKK
jgi:colicin import membrane protein